MSERVPAPRIRLRIENLSDLVFGLALSIGSLNLISRLPQSPTDMVDGIATFGFSFLIVVWIWSGYTSTMTLLPYEVRSTFLLNVLLLFCVALEPYLYFVINETQYSLLDFASSVYAVNLGAMMFILAGLRRVVTGEAKNFHEFPAHARERLRGAAIAQVIAGTVFLVSVLPPFWTSGLLGQQLRFDVWYAAMAILALGTRVFGRPSK